MIRLLFSLTFCLAIFPLFGNFPIIKEFTLNWTTTPVKYTPYEPISEEVLYFQGAQYNNRTPGLPYFSMNAPLPAYGKIKVTLLEGIYEPIAGVSATFSELIPENHQFLSSIAEERGQFSADIAFVPLRKSMGGEVERLVSFRIQIDFEAIPVATSRGPDGTNESVLATGSIYKIAVTQSGMHRLTYSFLEDLGVPVEDVDPRNIQLFGNGGGRLPEANAAFRFDDLQENAIFVSGETDGSFDPSDYLLFYGEGAEKWTYNEQLGDYTYVDNPYDTKNYYFIKIGNTKGKRVSDAPLISQSPVYFCTSIDGLYRYEEDVTNLLYAYSSTQGSGQEWFGDNFRITREREYRDNFSISNLLVDDTCTVKVRFAGRSGASTRFYVDAGEETYSNTLGSVNTSNSLGIYARASIASGLFIPGTQEFQLRVRYPETNLSSEGWLDYIELRVRQSLAYTNKQIFIRDHRSVGASVVSYKINGAANQVEVWDITNPLQATKQLTQVIGQEASFLAVGDSLKTFVAFRPDTDFFIPEAVGPIPNQNVHGMDNVDLVILYHSEFQGAASRLADHRSSYDDLNVGLVNIDELFNEFSSGRQDPVAIRDFAAMLAGRTERFNYLLLFGDASFDYRNKLNLQPSQRHHFIPTYETEESFYPIEAFPTDDYFALLSSSEGSNLKGALDIAVGRLPVKTAAEAEAMVEKIIQYDLNADNLGDWRNRIAMVADDEDSGTHFGGADRISEMIEANHPTFNLTKIYLDAFQQVATPGGARYPDVNNAINQNMFKGLLVMNYLGHGGSTGWAQERILLNNDITAWSNNHSPTLFVTATCSFTGFDEPNYETGGELAFLNSNGGAIGLFTTTRAVYAYSNERLTTAAFEFLFNKEDGQYARLGEVLRLAKNDNKQDTLLTNARKFALIGDPCMKLAIPEYRVQTATINGMAVGSSETDTLKALSKVTITGYVTDELGNVLSDFNGVVYPTIFDKRDTLQTLGQDPKSPVRSFTLQKNIIFKGAATVTNGQFSFTFVVPKDINYNMGFGKISYYAQDGKRDATGYYDGVVIGGTSSEALNDNQGPVVEVFMNNESFLFGGMTNENPTLFVKLYDDNGINVVGTSIGHDLTGTLDDDLQRTYILNDFYEAAQDDYRRGTVRYPLYKLEEGKHRVSVKAWDVANNSSTGFTEFVVASSEEIALKYVLNYPNPFSTQTWFEFQHNRPAGEIIDVLVRIYTISGKLVKTLRSQVISNGDRVSRADGLHWDGFDDYGDQLARGVYLYKVEVGSQFSGGTSLRGESNFEKLVILK